MDIGDEVARRRAEEARGREDARLAAEDYAARHAAAERQRLANLEVKDDALRSIGVKFVQWAAQAGIRPGAVTTKTKRPLFGAYKEVPKDIGWLLDPGQQGIPDKEGTKGWLQEPRDRIAILENGDIRIVLDDRDNKYLPRIPWQDIARIKELIVDFVVKSKSSAPWPD